MATVTTYTSMSSTVAGATYTVSSVVRETITSALEHQKAMADCHGVQPYYIQTGAGWRWTWEYVTEHGIRCSDTVRIFC